MAPAVSPAPASNTFQWHSEWYPVGIIEDLDPRRPHATHLLGIPLALWKDAQGQWRAVEDRCSHRWDGLGSGGHITSTPAEHLQLYTVALPLPRPQDRRRRARRRTRAAARAAVRHA